MVVAKIQDDYFMGYFLDFCPHGKSKILYISIIQYNWFCIVHVINLKEEYIYNSRQIFLEKKDLSRF